jgi:hypothetical protein
MIKTQFDEKRYIMPELRRYDLLIWELLDREHHFLEVIESLLAALPKYTKANAQKLALS